MIKQCFAAHNIHIVVNDNNIGYSDVNSKLLLNPVFLKLQLVDRYFAL